MMDLKSATSVQGNAHGNFKSKNTLADKLVGDDVRDSGRIQSRTFFTSALE